MNKNFFGKRGQFNVPFILLMIFLVAIIILGLMGLITGIMQIGISNLNASPLVRFAISLVPFTLILFLLIFAIVMLRGAGMGGGQ